MNEMKTYTKTRTILSMILAPLTYFLITQAVVTTASVIIGTRLVQQGVSQNDIYVRLTESIYRYNVLLTMISALITLPIVWFVFYQKEQQYTVHKAKLLWVIPLGGTVCITVNVLISLTGLFDRFPSYNDLAKYIYQGNMLFDIVGIAVVPAVIEELIYRGVLYRGFRKFLSPLWSILFTSLIFGAVHMNVVQFVYAMLLGIVFAWVYEKYKNLWAPVLTHMSANVFSVLMTEWGPLRQFVSTSAGSMTMLFLIIAGDILIPIVIEKTVYARS